MVSSLVSSGAHDTLFSGRASSYAGRALADDAGAAPFAAPEHLAALLADPGHAFELGAEALRAAPLDRSPPHARPALAVARHGDVHIAGAPDPAAGVRLAGNTDIAVTNPLDTHAIRVVNGNQGGVRCAVALGV